MKHSLRVGITGGIGSGKTAVTDRLAAFGISVVDADVVAREIVAPGSEALQAIAAHFGEHLIAPDGSLDRPALRRIVFAKPDERRWLEGLTHPLIGASIARQLETAKSAYVVLSSPLLLEGAQRDFVEHVVVVDVPETVQLARTMHRDNNDEALVRAIMDAQLSREARLAKADTVIDNSGDLADLDKQVDNLHRSLLAIARANGQTLS
jgi:dephospho-CoA kinase